MMSYLERMGSYSEGLYGRLFSRNVNTTLRINYTHYPVEAPRSPAQVYCISHLRSAG